MTVLSMVTKETNEDKLRWLFHIYDLDNDGRITLDEVLYLFSSWYTFFSRNLRPQSQKFHIFSEFL